MEATSEELEPAKKKIKVQIMNDEEDSEEDDEEEDDDVMSKHMGRTGHPDIDGGWAWVILGAFFIIFCISAGKLLNRPITCQYTTALWRKHTTLLKLLQEFSENSYQNQRPPILSIYILHV